uniref:Uncharacterized protein n=1 Tax=Anas platyrhynchos platyrhynchos TaxID=8840 RepID=A0A493SV52_ANAPP
GPACSVTPPHLFFSPSPSKFVLKNYGENPENYNEELRKLEVLRQVSPLPPSQGGHGPKSPPFAHGSWVTARSLHSPDVFCLLLLLSLFLSSL